MASVYVQNLAARDRFDCLLLSHLVKQEGFAATQTIDAQTDLNQPWATCIIPIVTPAIMSLKM